MRRPLLLAALTTTIVASCSAGGGAGGTATGGSGPGGASGQGGGPSTGTGGSGGAITATGGTGPGAGGNQASGGAGGRIAGSGGAGGHVTSATGGAGGRVAGSGGAGGHVTAATGGAGGRIAGSGGWGSGGTAHAGGNGGGGNGGAAPAGGSSGAGGATAVTQPPAPAASGKRWDLVFAEEFDGTSYDPAKLTPCFDWNSGDCTASFNQGRERYLPAQVKVSDGTAKLIAEPLAPPYASSACYQGQCTYKAGLLSTARPNATNGSSYLFPFTYGYVEARVKFPAVKGMFTAFWMLPTDPTYNYRSEIDIVEILGYDPTTIWMHYHYNNRSQSYSPNSGIGDNGACPVKDYSRDFVRFGMDWEPTSVAFYIDGVKCGQFTGTTSTVENGPMQLILHMMVDNNWEQSWSQTLDSLTTVAQLEVDYIHVFQQH